MRSKDEISQYAPWVLEKKEKKEREKRRSIPAKTNQKSKLRSKSKSRDHDYLDLYLMAREKERLEGYGRTLGERQKAIATTWKEVKSAMRNMLRELPPINEQGIEEFLEDEEKKKEKKNKKRGKIQKIDWDY